jgi:hypothetical protein
MAQARLVPLGLLGLALLAGCDGSSSPPRGEPATPPPTTASAPQPPAEAAPGGAALEAPPSATPSADPAAAPPPGGDPTARRVQLYFEWINYLLRSPKHGVPAEVADANLLLTTLRGRADEVRKLDVPEPCAQHHRQVLEMLDSAMALVDRMRALGPTKDQNALVAFAADRRALDEQDKQLDALAAEIKQAVPPPPPSPAPSPTP